MKLFELTGYKEFKRLSLSQILQRMIDKGEIKVRSGSFAFVVIPADKNYVYKVWNKDAGFEKFLEYVRRRPEDPHLPKLLGPTKRIKVFTNDKWSGDGVYVQKMEKLALRNNPDHEQFVIELILGIGERIPNAERVKELVKDQLGGELEQAFLDKQESFIKSYVDLVHLIKAVDFVNDSGGENILKRKDGTLVLNDPLYVPGQSKAPRAVDLIDKLDDYVS